MSSISMRPFTQKLGQLDCTIVDMPHDDGGIRGLVILCHGFGAPGDDLVPCVNELIASVPGLQAVRFIFPAAPLELDPTGLYDSRAWWPIDMFKLQEMIEKGQLRDLRADRPELLDQRYEQLIELIDEAKQQSDLSNGHLVLGGFSQGSMLATEVALRMEQAPAGLIVWSGTLLSETQWRQYAKTRGPLKIIQTHGQIDPILPFAGAQLLHEMFLENEFDAEFFPFMGPHTISPQGIVKAGELIRDVGRNP